MRRYVVVLEAWSLVAVCGCSLNRLTADRTIAMLDQVALSFNEEGDLAFARDAMPANLKMLEGLRHVSPDNAALGPLVAQGYCSYAFAFLETSEVERAKAMYRRGYEFGLVTLPEKLRLVIDGPLDGVEKALDEVGRDQVAALFWSAYCLGNWVNVSKDNVAALANLAKVELMMRRVLSLDETYYHGSAHLFFAAYYGGRPKTLGGDPRQAEDHVNRVLTLTSRKFLLAQLFYAQYVAVPGQDQALFDANLKEILDAPPDILPEERFANQVAKYRAARLVTAREDLF